MSTHWRDAGDYVLVTVPLSDWVGQRVRVRFVLRTTDISHGAGAYVDDVQVWDDG